MSGPGLNIHPSNLVAKLPRHHVTLLFTLIVYLTRHLLLQMSIQSYTRLVISHNKLIVILLKVNKEVDVSTQGVSLISDFMQLIRSIQECYTIPRQVEIYKQVRSLSYTYVSKLFLYTRNNIPPKPVTSYGTKPIIGDELQIKRSPLDNLEIAYCMKLVLKFSETQAGRQVK